MTIEEAARAYAAYFETLTPENLDLLGEYCAAEIHFRDPFNDVRGLPDLRAVFEDMFETLDEPRFSIVDRAISGRVCYMRWRFTFRHKRGGADTVRIDGMSEISFDEAGRAVSHLDHWDPTPIYESIPVVGAAIRFVRRRIGVSTRSPG